jgi:cobalt/nickel transport protein
MRWFTVFALAVAIALGTAFSPFASGSPDGLEKVAQDKGFVDRGRLAAVQQEAPAPDYAFLGVDDPRVATALAGFAGTLGVFLLAAGVVAVVRRRGTA